MFLCLMSLSKWDYIYFSLILKQHVQYTSWKKGLIKTVFWLFVLLLCNLANCHYYNNGYYCCCYNHFQNQNVSYLLSFPARGRMNGIMNMNTNESLSEHKQKHIDSDLHKIESVLRQFWPRNRLILPHNRRCIWLWGIVNYKRRRCTIFKKQYWCI